MVLRLNILGALGLLSFALSCKDQGEEVRTQAPISTDAELFRHVTQVDPFVSYSLFPRVDSVTSGTLNGSTAHQPLVRVSMNARAASALQNDTLPAGGGFPDSSVIFKQIMMNGQVQLYAVILKDRTNPLAGNGWLWAEFTPDGTPYISMTRRGVNCVGCHSRERGPEHDFVRTFERQR
jgi:hypothetical protein